ncbi:MAG: type III pantothenate kinase [Chloroflexi bacterium]|jgi:type III pantothenate kinase|nr:type III pantothenate kinase [Chloroflexota bacterium]
MLVTIDIGNTNIAVGVFDGDRLKVTWRVATGIHRLADEYGTLFLNLLQRQGILLSKIRGAALCSAVPPLVSTLHEVCQEYLGISPLVVEPGVRTGIRITIDNAREVGPDRIVNAVAAHHLYGEPVIIIDLGTATTFDVVSGGGDYLGGAIAPGIAIATEALFTRTAMLPRIELVRPKQVIGRSTISAMQSGIVFGYIGLIEGMVRRIEQELGSKTKVIATGGYAQLLAEETPAIDIVNSDLTLIGLRLIYEMNETEKS